MLNRRAYRRTKVQRKVEIEPLETARKSFWIFGSAKPAAPTAGKVVDIGCGGLCGEFPEPLDVGTPCDVRIEGPEGTVQHAHGTVRNVRVQEGAKLVGIAFDEPVIALGDPEREGPRMEHDGVAPYVMVVDDEPSVRMLLERFLGTRGLRVATAADAEIALEMLRQEEPALMLLDLKMPGISGVQLLETMSAEGLRVPNIWAMSAYVSDEEALAALSLGAGEFLNKPFDLDHIDFTLQLLSPML